MAGGMEEVVVLLVQLEMGTSVNSRQTRMDGQRKLRRKNSDSNCSSYSPTPRGGRRQWRVRSVKEQMESRD